MGQENRPCWFALPLFAGAASATIGFVAAWYGASAGLELSIGAALMLGIVAGIVALGNVSRQTKNAQRSWQLEIERLESQLAAETAAVLLEAGVGALEEIESKRQPGVFLSLFEIDPAWAGQLRRLRPDRFVSKGFALLFFKLPGLDTPVDLAHNFVLADSRCNSEKRDRLPAYEHLTDRDGAEREVRLGYGGDDMGPLGELAISNRISQP